MWIAAGLVQVRLLACRTDDYRRGDEHHQPGAAKTVARRLDNANFYRSTHPATLT